MIPLPEKSRKSLIKQLKHLEINKAVVRYHGNCCRSRYSSNNNNKIKFISTALFINAMKLEVVSSKEITSTKCKKDTDENQQ